MTEIKRVTAVIDDLGASVATWPMRELVTAEEWATRTDLAACYRLVEHYGMSDMIYSHITARAPGVHEHFLINGLGRLYTEVTASNLYKIDIDGKLILKPDDPYRVNPGGFVIHSAVHRARPDVRCVIHTHSRYGVAVSGMEEGLLPLSQFAMRFYNRLSYHEYEGPATNLEEQRRLVSNIGNTNATILRNHGLLVMGASIPEAFNRLYWLEMACKIQVDAMASRRLHMPNPDVALYTSKFFEDHATRPANSRIGGGEEWQAMLRLLDRKDASYRD